MTTDIKQLPQQAHALAMVHSYEEDPGVKKLKKGYKLLPKEALSGNGNLLINAAIFTVCFTLVMAMIVYAAAYLLNVSTGWAHIIIMVLGAAFPIVFLYPEITWTFTSPLSPVIINRDRREILKKTRHLAQRLGENVVPQLTEEHVKAVQHLQAELMFARTNLKDDSRDYDRLAILLLKDLSREPLLSNIITRRGITDMDEIEEALHAIEDDTIKPLEEGWL